MQAMLYSGVSQGTVDVARDAILQIVNSSCGDKVKIHALDALAKMCSNPTEMNITSCHFENNPATQDQPVTAVMVDYDDD